MTSYRCASEHFEPIKSRWPIRLYQRFLGVRADEALNCGGETDTTGDNDIAAQLKTAINRLVGEGSVTESGQVKYHELAESHSFQEYVQATWTLRNFNPWRLNNPDERKAFWINLYNALIIHAVIAYGIETSVRKTRGFFERAAYVVGGYRISANNIEHGILRANAGHPAFPMRHFLTNDPRRPFCLTKLDPRLHFALVCAAKSCPPVNIYQADQLRHQLDLAAHNFINNGGVVVDRPRKTVALSRIFAWYACDFGGSLYGYRRQSSLLRFVARYVESPRDVQYLQTYADKMRVQYLPYDWSLNG